MNERFGRHIPLEGPGALANVLVTTNAPQYSRVLEIIKSADGRDWRWDSKSRGVWVALHLLDSPIKRTQFKKVGPEEPLAQREAAE